MVEKEKDFIESADEISIQSKSPKNSADELVKRKRLEPEEVDEITRKLIRVINPRLYTVTIRKFHGVATVSWYPIGITGR